MKAGDIIIGYWKHTDGTGKYRPLLVLEETQMGLLRVAYGSSQRVDKVEVNQGEFVITTEDCPTLKSDTRISLMFRDLLFADQVKKIGTIAGSRNALVKFARAAREAHLV